VHALFRLVSLQPFIHRIATYDFVDFNCYQDFHRMQVLKQLRTGPVT